MIDIKDIKRIMAEKTPVEFSGIECIVKEYRLKIIMLDGKQQFAHCALLVEKNNDKVFYEARLKDVNIINAQKGQNANDD